jgi:hypothetical protein
MHHRPRHLDARLALDYLEALLPADRRREVEEHLGGPCPGCHDLVRDFGLLVERMRRDRTAEAPAWLHERALAAFRPPVLEPAVAGLVETLARLVFDSWASPLPAAARRAVGEARRLRFALDGHSFELEIEPESPGLLTLRGRLDAPDPMLCAIEISAEAERFIAMPDTNGTFLLERVPAGPLHVAISTPAGVFRLPPIAP